MQQTYYQFISRFVDYDADDPMSRLANAIHQDIGFPKQSEDFDEISRYLEHNSRYGKLLMIFDDSWHQYQYSI
ncbi:YozE family protein [Vaginisenegalia massiliensis]|uniref:YozE family protein n=1 Tax=Vaginisenegalia massiliensis TaxID=2058294 RepID=UPI000F542D22|nr:sterile alpha motif-like domain-containing protein [Vaginisenegalia massiliensis]